MDMLVPGADHHRCQFAQRRRAGIGPGAAGHRQRVATDPALQARAVEQALEPRADVDLALQGVRHQAADQFGREDQLQTGLAGELVERLVQRLGGQIEAAGLGLAG